jgi:hypothetical protein
MSFYSVLHGLLLMYVFIEIRQEIKLLEHFGIFKYHSVYITSLEH